MKEKNKTLLTKFKNSSLDPSCVGITPDNVRSLHFFLPDNMLAFAYATEQDVLFAVYDDMSEFVFAVNSDESGSILSIPIAASVQDFFGLLCTCKNVHPILVAGVSEKLQFQEAISAFKPTMKQRSVLRAIENIYHPAQIADPYDYLKSLLSHKNPRA